MVNNCYCFIFYVDDLEHTMHYTAVHSAGKKPDNRDVEVFLLAQWITYVMFVKPCTRINFNFPVEHNSEFNV